MSRPTKLNKFNWRELGIEYASPEYHRMWRQINSEHARAWRRKYQQRMYKEKPEQELARRKRYVAKYPSRIKANQAVKAALSSGKLIKQPCENCGNPKSVAHHPDYNKPLEIMWLCQLHHKQWHRGNSVVEVSNKYK